jgi:membrane protein
MLPDLQACSALTPLQNKKQPPGVLCSIFHRPASYQVLLPNLAPYSYVAIQSARMKKLKSIFSLFKNASIGFINDNAFKLSASLSYYTIFALCPPADDHYFACRHCFRPRSGAGKIYWQLNGLVGNEAALQIQNIITNIQQNQYTTIGAVAGALILVIGATGVFTEMQDSINYIWSVKAKPKKAG